MLNALNRILALLGCSILLFGACRRDRNEFIPDVAVDITANINNPGYINLAVIGGWMYFQGGSKGIVVYRYSNDMFMAYDRHCPYIPGEGCTTAVDTSNNLNIKCPCCGSVFIITDGSISSGPAERPLKRYQTYFDGSAILHIYN